MAGRSLSGLTAEEFLKRSTPQLTRLARQALPLNLPKSAPVPPLADGSLSLQSLNDYGVLVLTVGTPPLALRAAFTPAEARHLAAALEEHARLLDEFLADRGDDPDLPPQGDAA